MGKANGGGMQEGSGYRGGMCENRRLWEGRRDLRRGGEMWEGEGRCGYGEERCGYREERCREGRRDVGRGGEMWEGEERCEKGGDGSPKSGLGLRPPRGWGRPKEII